MQTHRLSTHCTVWSDLNTGHRHSNWVSLNYDHSLSHVLPYLNQIQGRPEKAHKNSFGEAMTNCVVLIVAQNAYMLERQWQIDLFCVCAL